MGTSTAAHIPHEGRIMTFSASFTALFASLSLPSTFSSMPGLAHTGPGPFWGTVFQVAAIVGWTVYGIMAALVVAAGWRRVR